MPASIGLIAAIIAILGLLFKAWWLLGLAAVIFLLGGGVAFVGVVDIPKGAIILAILLIVFVIISKKK